MMGLTALQALTTIRSIYLGRAPVSVALAALSEGMSRTPDLSTHRGLIARINEVIGMADAELLKELEVAAVQVARVKCLPVGTADAFVRSLSDTFVSNAAAQWWWESLRVPSKHFRYGSGDGISIMLELIKAEKSVVLVVTEDTHPPLALYEGEPGAIVELIRECRFFEYALAAPDASWIVFDTHMNELIAAGRIVR